MNNGKICVSVCAETADELIGQIKRAEDLADVIEIRFDCLENIDLENISDRLIISKLQKLRLSCEKPFLITYRAFEEGGRKQITLDGNRIPFWENLKLDLPQLADFVDCEWELLGNVLNSWRFYKNVKSSKIICSFHNFNMPIRNLETLLKTFNLMSEIKLGENFDSDAFTKRPIRNTDIIKIAVLTDDITDSIPIWKLLERAKAKNKQIIPIAMGESGKWTRILGLAHGAFMTYAALDAGQETAPGQVSAKDLIEVYRAKKLNEETEVYGILGSNTSVSMSPYIHNAAFKFHNLNAVFVPLQVNDLDEFIRRMVKPETREVELNFKGFAVTIPHKQNIIKHLDYIDETAKKIGAVNTVKIVNGKLHGYNTDAKGFIEPLLNSYGDLQNAKVAVLGAGGAARACVFALKTAGAKVTIFARDIQKAQNLADDFQIELKAQSTQHSALSTFEDFDILVNTTPLGMKGKAEGETSAVAEQLKGLHLVYDLVYIPFQTQLMKEADRAEVPKIGGLAMLIAQAMEQQKIWTGKDAPMKEMSRAVLKRLQ
jgi:3-dehydroquinate dehydratase / shikimate dehydrogenase